MESMTSQSIEEDNEDVTVVDGGGGGRGAASMRVDGSIEITWKHYMMFSGTSLLMHSERIDIEGSSSSSGSSSDSIPSAPDKGCLVEVVRTGFGTSQVRRGDDADDDSHDDDYDGDGDDDDDDDSHFMIIVMS